ncbi:MAG: hypothetical protein IJA34_00750 [Lachnospiraceae bacterium]|nr:hypothetical protein [Lachnospiraceae bacterium]
MNVTINNLRCRAAEIEENLNEAGFIAEVKPYFAYGKYSYILHFYNNAEKKHTHEGYKQISFSLGTKAECYYKLNEAYYQALEHEKYYKFQSDKY